MGLNQDSIADGVLVNLFVSLNSDAVGRRTYWRSPMSLARTQMASPSPSWAPTGC